MSVDPVINANQIPEWGQAVQPREKGFDGFVSADFMKLLMTQLTHQNPLEPLNDAEMMSQFAQLNSLQELQTIKASVEQAAQNSRAHYSAGLIGKKVKAILDDGSVVEGVVNGVSPEKDRVNLQVGEDTVPLNSLVEIKGE